MMRYQYFFMGILFSLCIAVLGVCLYFFVTHAELRKNTKDLMIDFAKVLGKALRLLGKGLAVLAKWVYEEATGNDWPGEEINREIILAKEEADRFTQLFEKYMYLAPVLWCESNTKGIFLGQLTAIDYLERLQDLPVEQLKTMAVRIVQKGYMKVRGFTPTVYILSISPQRLVFAIPLSEAGRKYLERMIQTLQEREKIQKAAEQETLSEEVPPLKEELPQQEEKGE